MNMASLAIAEQQDAAKRIVFEVSVKAAERIALALDAEENTASLPVALFDLGQSRVEASIYLPPELPPARVLDLIARVANGEAPAEIRVERLDEQDWVTLSQEKRGAVHAGRFVIHGSHERKFKNRYAIEIDAGQAFGTAHHASTLGCLLMLDHVAKRRRFARVLDLGTGAGTLAIAAARLGRQRVLASDNDPIAVAVAWENVRKNRAGRQVETLTAAGLAHPRLRRAKFDLIFANILFRPLMGLAPALARRIAPRGRLILSGITEEQSTPLKARYASLGFVLKRRVVIDGWATLLMAPGSHRPARLIGNHAADRTGIHVSKLR
jgi:ribosomal protein L11 methyltransferase